MEINKETLNSLKRGDFIKVRESDGWKKIKDLQRWNGNVVRIDVNYRNYIPNAYFKYIPVSYYIADVLDIKKCNSTHIIMDNIQPDPNSWIRSSYERLGNPWEFTEFDWKKTQEKIQKAMNKGIYTRILEEDGAIGGGSQAFADTHQLHKGISGCPTAVKWLQTRLNELGYYHGYIDGKFGNGTDTAVKAFQNARGLKADGWVGVLTTKELLK